MRTKQVFKLTTLALLLTAVVSSCSAPKAAKEDTLKDALQGKFFIGAAVNVDQMAGKDSLAIEVVKKNFSSIVAENCMKMENIHPVKGEFFFDEADAFVEFGEKNNMKIIGHTLIWHSQAAKWAFVDDEGKDVSREELIERMRNHIHTIVGRYKGRVHGWDVVNEAILDNGEWRQSKWYTIIGPEFVQLAFEFAHEADPNAELYYNDYNEWIPAKRDGIYNMVKDLIDKGVKVDGIGLQGHIALDSPSIELYEEAIVKYASLGVQTMVTELDITVLPWPSQQVTADISFSAELSTEYNPFVNGLPDSVSVELTNRFASFFELFLKHQDKIDRVTLWGVHDGQSWKNNWPIRGRKDYPLLFDRQYQSKPAVQRIIELAKQ